MPVREKFKTALKNPKKIISYLFKRKKSRILEFFKKNYFSLDPGYVFEKLNEYWIKYRFLIRF